MNSKCPQCEAPILEIHKSRDCGLARIHEHCVSDWYSRAEHNRRHNDRSVEQDRRRRATSAM